jgi:hypothetical protein
MVVAILCLTRCTPCCCSLARVMACHLVTSPALRNSWTRETFFKLLKAHVSRNLYGREQTFFQTGLKRETLHYGPWNSLCGNRRAKLCLAVHARSGVNARYRVSRFSVMTPAQSGCIIRARCSGGVSCDTRALQRSASHALIISNLSEQTFAKPETFHVFQVKKTFFFPFGNNSYTHIPTLTYICVFSFRFVDS